MCDYMFGLCRKQHDVKRINISMLTVENVSYVLWKDAKVHGGLRRTGEPRERRRADG